MEIREIREIREGAGETGTKGIIAAALYGGGEEARTGLTALLTRAETFLPVRFSIRLCDSPSELLDGLAAEAFDVVFLELEPADYTCVLVDEELRRHTRRPLVVCVSKSDAVCGAAVFRLNGALFLHKPLREGEVRDVLDNVSRSQGAKAAYFTYRQRDEVHAVPLADILFFESSARRVRVVTPSETAWFYRTLNQVEAELANPSFCRIHHSFLVNLHKVEGFDGSRLRIAGSYCLPVSQSRQAAVSAASGCFTVSDGFKPLPATRP